MEYMCQGRKRLTFSYRVVREETYLKGRSNSHEFLMEKHLKLKISIAKFLRMKHSQCVWGRIRTVNVTDVTEEYCVREGSLESENWELGEARTLKVPEDNDEEFRFNLRIGRGLMLSDLCLLKITLTAALGILDWRSLREEVGVCWSTIANGQFSGFVNQL
jgi:hypothetical protein